ncbi:MAG: Thivi_2564 family membrane protein [Candidatus Kapaibacterium sp.]
MDILTVLITLVAAGFILWLINRIPMQSTIKTIVNVVVVLIVVIWLFKTFGLWAYLSNLTV